MWRFPGKDKCHPQYYAVDGFHQVNVFLMKKYSNSWVGLSPLQLCIMIQDIISICCSTLIFTFYFRESSHIPSANSSQRSYYSDSSESCNKIKHFLVPQRNTSQSEQLQRKSICQILTHVVSRQVCETCQCISGFY